MREWAGRMAMEHIPAGAGTGAVTKVMCRSLGKRVKECHNPSLSR